MNVHISKIPGTLKCNVIQRKPKFILTLEGVTWRNSLHSVPKGSIDLRYRIILILRPHDPQLQLAEAIESNYND